MNLALASMCVPLVVALGLMFNRHQGGRWVILSSLISLMCAALALQEVQETGRQYLMLGGWESPLGIRFELGPLNALLLCFTALVHLLVALYAQGSRNASTRDSDLWPLASLLHASLVALWMARDLFNWYVALELLGLVAVGLIILSGPKSHAPALRYLLLSLAGSLCYLLGVALLYGRYGILDINALGAITVADATTRAALLLISVGLMLKGALWPLHLWLPAAHASAPTSVSALLSALVVKGPLFILWLIWVRVAPPEFGQQIGVLFALAGVAALLAGGWSALRTPYLKTLVAFSTVAQLGYALLALGLLLHWQRTDLSAALWLFVIAHGLAKVSMFLAAGEMQATLGSKRVDVLKGASQSMPVAMFAFAVAGGSLIGLPPSGGFVAKWVLLQPLLENPAHWHWALAVLLGTLASAAYVFRVVALSFNRADPLPQRFNPDPFAQWLALIPALLVWGLALISEPLILWLTEVAEHV